MIYNTKQLKKDIYWRYMTIDSESENIYTENNNHDLFDIDSYRKQLTKQIKKL